jgi:hypothetical protein
MGSSKRAQRKTKIERCWKARKKIREVDNVEDVENGGKKCLRFSLNWLRYIFSDFSCQVPIDIFIPHP